jgi:cholestenol Delta-isomerase
MGSIIQSFNGTSITSHPYYPLEVEIASYLANEWSVPVLLGTFAGVCSAVLITTLLIVNKVHPNLKGTEKAAIWWFVLCEFLNQCLKALSLTINVAGCIHLFFEGT